MECFLLIALTLLGPGRINKEVAPKPLLEVQCGSAEKCVDQICLTQKEETQEKWIKKSHSSGR